jgi:hypothetical protein
VKRQIRKLESDLNNAMEISNKCIAERYSTLTCRVSDPDPDWILIVSGFNQVSGSGSVFGIRIRIQEGKNYPQKQGCGSGSELDPDSIGSGSRRAKMTHKSRKIQKFHVLSKC